MVTTFLAAAVGLGPVFDPQNPLGLDRNKFAAFAGRVQPSFAIDMEQIRKLVSGNLSAAAALNSLCCMLANTAYESVKGQRDTSLEFEFFRHLRNASSHGNRFNFFPKEPSRPASWRGVVIDENGKGSANALQGTQCFGHVLDPADVILLLWDIEQRLP